MSNRQHGRAGLTTDKAKELQAAYRTAKAESDDAAQKFRESNPALTEYWDQLTVASAKAPAVYAKYFGKELEGYSKGRYDAIKAVRIVGREDGRPVHRHGRGAAQEVAGG